MPITITDDDERQRVRLDLDVPRSTERLVLVDEDGKEYHFGCGMWMREGTFLHVATYSREEGLHPYAFFFEVVDAIEEGKIAQLPEPDLGPKLSPRTIAALVGLRQLCNLHNGFSGDPEKSWAVNTLRALWEGAGDRFNPQEVYVWAATHGWGIKHAKALQKLADGVREGKNFRDYAGRAITRDRGQWRRMIERWDEDVAAASASSG